MQLFSTFSMTLTTMRWHAHCTGGVLDVVLCASLAGVFSDCCGPIPKCTFVAGHSRPLVCACRTLSEVTGGQGKSGQTIEMVEGSYSNADSHAAANPFGFDSFGNSLAAPAQHTSRPPRVQQPNRQPLVGHL